MAGHCVRGVGDKLLMPRTPRDFEPGRIYHLISRLVDRNWYIRTDDERSLYLKLLGRSFERSDWRCLSDGIMSNHIHLCTVAGRHSFSNLMQRIHAPFATWMNRAYQRIGAMFVRGPKAIEVREEGVASVIAYIHNNPVRAGIVSSAEESNWTSHRAYVGLDRAPKWLDVDEGLRRSGFSDRREFTGWVATNPNVDDIAASVDTAFADDGDDPQRAISSRPPERQAAVSAETVVEVTASVLDVPMRRFLVGGRRSPELFARRVVVHCASTLGASGVEIADALRVTQQAVSKIQLRDPDASVIEVGDRVLQQLRLVR